MSTTATNRTIPSPRGRASEASPDLAALRAATYIEFLLGHGEAPGVDLGSPIAFDRDGTVYSQRFARGLTLANVGSEAVEVTLDRPYYDLIGALRTSVILAANRRRGAAVSAHAVPHRECKYQVAGVGAAADGRRSIPVDRNLQAASWPAVTTGSLGELTSLPLGELTSLPLGELTSLPGLKTPPAWTRATSDAR